MFERASKIADAVLYEGFLLFPYRASARKNQIRWQFGVLAPRPWSDAGGGEAWWCQTECLLDPKAATRVEGRLRFLQIERREVQQALDADGTRFERVNQVESPARRYIPWDEGVPQTLDFTLDLTAGVEQVVPIRIDGGERSDLIRDAAGGLMGRVIWRRWPATGRVVVSVQPGPGAFKRLRVRVENDTAGVDGRDDRDSALRYSFMGVHTLLGVSGGEFLSQIDPPGAAREASSRCENVRAFPVLVGPTGDSSLILSSPIVLYDHPEIAPESQGDMFDATEVDELLTLTTLCLTDEEKREARATDDRARAIIDRVEAMSAEAMKGLHGTLRSSQGASRTEQQKSDPPVGPGPGDDWLRDAQAAGPQTLKVGSVLVGKGSSVRLRPGSRRSDAQDMFLVERIGRVEAVMQDAEGTDYLAVSLEEDPASELNRWHGRFLYFYADEVEPLETPA